MYISPTMDLLVLLLLAASAVCLLLLALFYIFRVRPVINYRLRADRERPDKPESQYLPASIVVYSQGDAEHLESLLRRLLSQDYPAAYEVIVVNEGESGDVRDVVSLLRAVHPNLYLTFTPEGVVNLSRKKLALTLGIKAARYNTIVLTTTAAEIESDRWLRRMMFNFNEGSPVEVVLGFAYIDPDEDENRGRRRRAFGYIVDSVRWLAVAIAGKPFRGTEYNIAYTKDVFLRHKGFARSLNLHYGDDDIFVSQIAKGDNTVLELSEDSLVRLRQGNHPRLFTERVLRRFFTERFISRRPRFLVSLSGWIQILGIGCAVAAGVLAYPNLLPALIALVPVLGMFVLDIIFWRKAMIALKSRRMLLTLPWFSITYPLLQLWRRIYSKLGKQKKYTWD